MVKYINDLLNIKYYIFLLYKILCFKFVVFFWGDKWLFYCLKDIFKDINIFNYFLLGEVVILIVSEEIIVF